ncbi:helix-hairpin-helix domain-containing protein [Alkalihalobacillus pseudalcaliphilus]|uniref:helix-hairpin-helix domain-containing protein n=1 Tax=Alkalihalobacillus pseudalcaliphilus TaxID=79884 RepID=UPI00064E0DB8|nr:helix-hairpin-helix domain-containing protein [Alkalihalobacillus pseudalcaliphilus]KMK75930.1 competence protein ComEA [Alkalihalobacillus pseudalcaliphilus]
MKKLSIREWLVLIASGLMVIFSLGLFTFVFNRDKPQAEEANSWAFLEEGKTDEEANHDKEQEDLLEVVVDIKGAVKIPGIYVMEQGDRIHEVIEKAGGLSDEADDLQVNLASLLEDEMVIYIPFQSDEDNQAEVIAQLAASQDQDEVLINLNTATQVELERLPGVGPSKATQIITYRDEHGKFTDIQELTNVSGFGEKSFEQLKDLITVK